MIHTTNIRINIGVKKYWLSTVLLVAGVFGANAQKAKDGSISLSPGSSTTYIPNRYTTLTTSVAAGNTDLFVSDINDLSGSTVFTNSYNPYATAALSYGDLIMIIQMQGADITTTDNASYGAITNYNNVGNYELKTVLSVSGNVITVCGTLSKSYTVSGRNRVQVIRVPRLNNLTIGANAIFAARAWNGSTGGVLAYEVDGNLVVNGRIDVSGLGFRGGVDDAGNKGDPGTTLWRTTNEDKGAGKGESIAGNASDYNSLLNGYYGKGAPANGGGGGNGRNGGGGGGSNAGNSGSLTPYNGTGLKNISVSGWDTAWNLEAANFATDISRGGGRGGYTYSDKNRDAKKDAPGNTNWGQDDRRIEGGHGGRPLDYAGNTKLFMGGGGGSGNGNKNDQGAGGNGGGIIVLLVKGTVSGTGQILANGANGFNTINPHDYAAGGAGGGGAIVLLSNSTITSVTIRANGGNGGNILRTDNRAHGPGGGGGGGYILTTSTTVTRTVNGGNNGTTTSSAVTEFPPNGATMGSPGTIVSTGTFYEIPVCSVSAVNNIDRDGDGISDFYEVGSCSGSSAFSYDGYPNGTSPNAINLTTGPVTHTVSRTSSPGVTVSNYEIRNQFTATAEKEIYVVQNLGAAGRSTLLTFNFSYPIYDVNFRIQDIDLYAGQFKDSIIVRIYYKNTQINLNPSMVTTGSYCSFVGNNTIVGRTGNSADNETLGQAIISFPYMLDKIEIVYLNADPSYGNQGIGIGGFTFCQLSTADNDGDGLPNYLDLDSDNDGIPDIVEAGGVDINGDGKVDVFVDANNNGLADKYDPAAGGIDITTLDFNGAVAGGIMWDWDGDGVPNFIDLDSDNDGIPDIVEALGVDANNDGSVDGYTDVDADGLHDTYDGDVGNDGVAENTANALITTGADSNNDGRPDAYLKANLDRTTMPNPYDLDSDGDGLADVLEAGITGISYSNGVVTSGSLVNGWSNAVSALPALALRNSDAHGNPDFLDIDSDNDGISDNVEAQSTGGNIVPTDADTDWDGIADVYDVSPTTYGANGLTPYNFDADAFPDYRDTDSDNDGAPDRNEGDRNFKTVTQATINASGDTDGDGMMDLFDTYNIVTATGNFFQNVGMSNMGPAGNFDGPVPGASTIQLQRSNATGDRDWRQVSVLPLHVLSFNVTLEDNKKVVTQWKVQNEFEVKSYEVERSTDATQFVKVGTVAAINQNTHTYQFEESWAQAHVSLYYYRIKQLDRNGAVFYTNTVMVKRNLAQVEAVLYPNPAINTSTLKINAPHTTEAQVRVVSANGKVMSLKSLKLNKGENFVQVADINQWPAGLYIVQCTTTSGTITLKLMKQ